MTLMPIRYSNDELPFLFDGLFSNFDTLLPALGSTGFAKEDVFPIDVEDSGKAYIITADVAGAKPEGVEVTLQKDVVTISVNKQVANNTSEVRNYLFRERRNSNMSRSIRLKHTKGDAKAELKDGTLTVTVLKDEQVLPRKIEITTG